MIITEVKCLLLRLKISHSMCSSDSIYRVGPTVLSRQDEELSTEKEDKGVSLDHSWVM